MSTGTLLAFPGSMVGALCCGLVYRYTNKLTLTYVGEVFGTGILGALLAFPVAAFIMGKEAALFAYVIPFLVSTAGGTLIAFILITVLSRTKLLNRLQGMLTENGGRA